YQMDYFGTVVSGRLVSDGSGTRLYACAQPRFWQKAFLGLSVILGLGLLLPYFSIESHALPHTNTGWLLERINEAVMVSILLIVYTSIRAICNRKHASDLTAQLKKMLEANEETSTILLASQSNFTVNQLQRPVTIIGAGTLCLIALH